MRRPGLHTLQQARVVAGGEEESVEDEVVRSVAQRGGARGQVARQRGQLAQARKGVDPALPGQRVALRAAPGE